ncbi:ATP-binding protein [Hirschia litorea]|uniref:histidine kinase n=1 Tax=Hirschia litorea TaxID=1199156 RepID=A0ABW2IHI0_9PROT
MNNLGSARLFLLTAKLSGWLSLLIGIFVLGGWFLKYTPIIQLPPSFAIMQFNTALCFVLSGVGLLSLHYERYKIVFFASLFVWCIAATTIYQYLSNTNVGIDLLFMKYYPIPNAAFPGRMSPNTSICFLLVGGALISQVFFNTYRHIQTISRVLGSLILAFGVVAFIGSIAALETTYAWINFPKMALHTSFAFAAVGLSIVTFTWWKDPAKWEMRAHLWFCGFTIFVALLLSAALWQKLREQEQEIVRESIEEEVNFVARRISDQLDHIEKALTRMSKRLEGNILTSQKDWLKDTSYYLEDFVGLQRIAWVDISKNLRWVDTVERSEGPIGVLDSSKNDALMSFQKAVKFKKPTLSPPLNLEGGAVGFRVYIPIERNNLSSGVLISTFEISSFMKSVILPDQIDGFSLDVTEGTNVLFHNGLGNAEVSKLKNFQSFKTINAFDRQWAVTLTANSRFVRDHQTSLPQVVLFGGVLFSLLTGFLVYSTILSKWKNKLLRSKTEALQDSEERYRVVVENAVNGLITIDTDGLIETFNPACEKIFGYARDEVIGKNIKLLMPAAYRAEHDKHLSKSQPSNKVIEFGREVHGLRRDQTEFPMELSVSQISISNRILYSGIIKDISERVQVERARDKLFDKLNDSNEELERFAYVCSHDMQEPLRMIRSFSTKLQNHLEHKLEGDDKGQRYFKYVIDGATRAQDLIADILAYSSLDRDTQKPVLVDLEKLHSDIQNIMQTNLDECGGELTYFNLPKVIGNETQLYQLFQNLIINGLKYQPLENCPRVEVKCKDVGSHWRFSVKDNGIGIEERHLKKIFDVFQRLHRQDEYSGTGVGLAICKKIVARHGGEIWVESTKGKGTVFYFTLAKHNNGNYQ